ncbi:medium-chain acyl-CoA ligase ACSF2, mitochondrial-like [Argopecten irradians]|uniref:medium-chain acyl-CoA ligase ACSF2, mitochondrial-like n=1 Tax=Argopecten irradians TaxID=31199 RepID=UPI0037136233
MSKWSYLHCNSLAPNKYITLNDVIKRNAEKFPHTEAFIYRNEHGDRQSITFGDLYEQGRCVAQYLVKSGVQRQDKIGLFGPNTLARIVAECGILLAGAVVLHLNIDVQNGSDCKDVLEKAKCKVVFADLGVSDAFLPLIRSLIATDETNHKRQKLIFLRKPDSANVTDTLLNDIQTSGNYDLILPDVCPEDDAVIFTTSGSTGKPKMVVHSHFAFTAAVGPIFDMAVKRKTSFNNRPFGYSGGSLAIATALGCTRVFTDSALGTIRNEMKIIWKIIAEEHVDIALLMPFSLYDLITIKDNIVDDGYRLDTITTTGQVIDTFCARAIGRFCKSLRIGYGSTETIGVSALSTSDDNLATGNVGKPHPGVEIRVVDEDGCVVPIGEEGTVQVRSTFLMKRYFHDAEKTRDAFTKEIPGWFKMEDIGLISASGDLIVRGRVKENISRGGRKILPGVIDDVVKQMEGISRVATVAVPDVRLYEEVCVCYVTEEGAELLTSDVQLYCEDKFTNSEAGDGMGSMPKYFVMFDNFPVLYTGKVDKQTLKRQASDRLGLSSY